MASILLRVGPILDRIYLAAAWLAGAMLVAVGAIMLLMSGGREVGFNLRGGDEIAAWLCASIFGLGLAHVFRRGEVVRVGLLIENVAGRRRQFMEIGCLAIGCVATGALAYYCVELVWESYRFGDMGQCVLIMPIWVVQLGLGVGAVLQFVAFVEQLLKALAGQRPDYARDAPKTAEEVMERAASAL
jgi:TRAP-type C4-dicarboxylate transport system permease small subunit